MDSTTPTRTLLLAAALLLSACPPSAADDDDDDATDDYPAGDDLDGRWLGTLADPADGTWEYALCVAAGEVVWHAQDGDREDAGWPLEQRDDGAWIADLGEFGDGLLRATGDTLVFGSLLHFAALQRDADALAASYDPADIEGSWTGTVDLPGPAPDEPAEAFVTVDGTDLAGWLGDDVFTFSGELELTAPAHGVWAGPYSDDLAGPGDARATLTPDKSLLALELCLDPAADCAWLAVR